MKRDESKYIANLHREALVWDNHGCMPHEPDADLAGIERYARSGANVVFLNVGFDLISCHETTKVLARFRSWVLARPESYVLIGSVDDIRRAQREGKLAVGFDIEGGNALDGELAMIELYRALGVRWMLLAYNQNNALASGCNDEDTGLTELGRRAVAEMNRVGMIVDCSHTGYRATMEMMEISVDPVTFSHSNPRALVDHKRNITDDQIRACAAKGGVIGINGVGRFLGDPNVQSTTIVRHIDYVVQSVGAEHVGIGLDCVFDLDEIHRFHMKAPEAFPEGLAWSRDQARYAVPEQLPEITEGLVKLGYAEGDIRGILGGNFLRVAEQVWR